MSRGPLQLFGRRTLRGLAAFVVTFLMAGQVLAATGLCLVTVPDAPATIHESSAGCAEHQPTDPVTGVKHHCPAEEPSPQARSVDLPAPLAVAAVASVVVYLVEPVAGRLVATVSDNEAPPPPLYARLQRLRL
jgi:hypothetical protein